MAVFYRVNSLSRALEMALRSRDVPYVIVAGVEFFQRREVKDLLAYARLVENPFDEAAFLRIANVPRRGVGAASLTKLRHAAIDAGISTLEAARRGLGGVSGRAKKGLLDLIRVARRRAEVTARTRGADPRSPGDHIRLPRLARAAGRRRRAVADRQRGRARRRSRTTSTAGIRPADLRSFLERTALVSDQDGYEERVTASA